MLIRILAFLLETFFFVLIGAALLRAWMNGCRVNMRAQPGSFVMAVTDWLVKPLRRVLPKAWAHSMKTSSFNNVSDCRGVFERSRRARQDSPLGPSNVAVMA